MSEPEFLIWSLNLREDWAVVVCLVGGGQEINTGEAGIREWLRSLNDSFPDWNVFISDHLTGKEYAEGELEVLLQANTRIKRSSIFLFSRKILSTSKWRIFRVSKGGAFSLLEKFSGRNWNFILPQKRV